MLELGGNSISSSSLTIYFTVEETEVERNQRIFPKSDNQGKASLQAEKIPV